MPEHQTTAHVLVLALRAALAVWWDARYRGHPTASPRGVLIQHLADAARRFLKTLFDRDRIGRDRTVLLVQDLARSAHVRVHRQLQDERLWSEALRPLRREHHQARRRFREFQVCGPPEGCPLPPEPSPFRASVELDEVPRRVLVVRTLVDRQRRQRASGRASGDAFDVGKPPRPVSRTRRCSRRRSASR